MSPSSRLVAVCFALFGGSLPGQLVINEVLYDPPGVDAGQEVIELANLGPAAASLTGWSLCINQDAFGRVYWSFPAGTSIPAGGFLRVRWLTNGSNSATELFTGTAAAGFDCLGPFALNNTNGSVSLYRIPGANCAGFGLPANIVDFVQWGSTTLREIIAVAAGIWTAGDFVPLVAEGSSVAYAGSGDRAADYFEDLCPTLGAANTGPGTPSVSNYGAGCAGSSGVPVFVTVGGPPALGNQSFALNVQNGLAGAPSILLLGTQTSFPLLGCTLLALPVLSVPWTVGPDLPVPLPCDNAILGGQLFFQWAIIDTAGPGGVAFSDGLQVGF